MSRVNSSLPRTARYSGTKKDVSVHAASSITVTRPHTIRCPDSWSCVTVVTYFVADFGRYDNSSMPKGHDGHRNGSSGRCHVAFTRARSMSSMFPTVVPRPRSEHLLHRVASTSHRWIAGSPGQPFRRRGSLKLRGPWSCRNHWATSLRLTTPILERGRTRCRRCP